MTTLARYFELWLLKLEGVLPPLERAFPAELAEKMRRMMRIPPAQLKSFTLPEEESKTAERILGAIIEGHLEKRLKSRALLAELL